MSHNENKRSGSLITIAVVGVATALLVNTLMDEKKRKKLRKFVEKIKDFTTDAIEPVVSKAEELIGHTENSEEGSSPKPTKKSTK